MITELRDELVGELAPLGTVHRTVPETITPPCAIVQPGDPFVVDDDPDLTFGEPYAMRFDVIVLVELDDEHDNEAASDQLDQLLDQLLALVRDSDAWRLESMSQPGPFVTTTWASHGQRVTLKRTVQL